MLDINTIISKIKGIDQAIATYYDYCRKITEEINSVSSEYQSGEKSLIINIRRKIKDYLNENFDDITKRCDEIERSLSKYCPDVFTKKITGQENSLRDLSVDELNTYLDEQISLLNEKLTDLNNLDFDSVLPPQTITKKKGKIKNKEDPENNKRKK